MEEISVKRLTANVVAPTPDIRRTNTFRFLLDTVIRPRNRSMVDLGAGPCIFARIARDRGYQVTAVDARTVRVPPAKELGSIRFVESDVREFNMLGFGVVACLGLLYHLPTKDQLNLLKRCSYGANVIIETEVHDPALITSKTPAPWQTKIVKRGNYEGVVFPENDNPMAAVGNAQSFWHTEASWLRLFSDAGYKYVTIIEPRFQSKYGGRQFFLLDV